MSIECVVGDALKFGNGEKPGYDRILLDAPCTGTGVLSKRLDMKWRLTESDVIQLAVTQRNLLKNAACHVKPGGILVYSTCSLEPEERIF